MAYVNVSGFVMANISYCSCMKLLRLLGENSRLISTQTIQRTSTQTIHAKLSDLYTLWFLFGQNR